VREAEKQAMSIPPESIQAGKCYLDDRHRILHVTHVTPDSFVRFKYRDAHLAMADAWWAGMLSLQDFAAAAAREVPCDWTL
jgi:hypothetical protein